MAQRRSRILLQAVLLTAVLSAGAGGCSRGAAQPPPRLEARDRPRAEVREREVSTFCYRTLAEPECYARPAPSESSRLIN